MSHPRSNTLWIHISETFVVESQRITLHSGSDRSTLARYLLERAILELTDPAPGTDDPLLSLGQIDPQNRARISVPLPEPFENELREQAQARGLAPSEWARILLVSSLEPNPAERAMAEALSATALPLLPITPRAVWLVGLTLKISAGFERFDQAAHLALLFSKQERRALGQASGEAGEGSGDARRL